MIPMMNIVAWSNVVPWVDMRQVEQDLIISRAIVDLFSDAFLHEQLRFRGGTALHKLQAVVSRSRRHCPGGMVFEVLNRGVGRWLLFTKDKDFLAFERVVEETLRIGCNLSTNRKPKWRRCDAAST